MSHFSSSYTVFAGNTDASSVVTQQLSVPVIARYVRLHPAAWNTAISMAFELQGCEYEQTGVGVDKIFLHWIVCTHQFCTVLKDLIVSVRS